MTTNQDVQKRLMKIAREVEGLTWADRMCIGQAIALIDAASPSPVRADAGNVQGEASEFLRIVAEGIPDDVTDDGGAVLVAIDGPVAAEIKRWAAPDQHAAFDCYSDNDGDVWRDCPDDAEFVDGLKVGDTYELLCGWATVRRTFRVTKAPDDQGDDYAVEMIAPAAALDGTHS